MCCLIITRNIACIARAGFLFLIGDGGAVVGWRASGL